MINDPAIRIKGARQHNLKALDLDIPLNKITVVTGVSGSGKSSLAFHTLYAEGRMRYVETFSPYARQFMERMERAIVDRIENVPPAIAIDRNEPVRTSRSTLGTMTELTDYIKLLFARLGILHCRKCGRPVKSESPRLVMNVLEDKASGREVLVTFPWRMSGDHGGRRARMEQLGFTRVFEGGEIVPLGQLDPGKYAGEIQIVVDRVRMDPAQKSRIVDSLEQAFRFGRGRLRCVLNREESLSFSSFLQCPDCNILYREPPVNLFSFNSPVGACETCRGFGRTIGIDPDLVVPDKELSLEEGAVRPWGGRKNPRKEFKDLMRFCRRENIPVDIPFKKLSRTRQKAILEGTPGYYGVRGFFKWLETKSYKMHVRVFLSRFRSYDVCPDCHGTRFNEEALLYRVNGRNIGEIYSFDVDGAVGFFDSLVVPGNDKAAAIIIHSIQNRLRFLSDVGLGYVSLDRQSRTLSGGEVQRASLAAALGSSLVNTLYVLDEPSIGLHPRDSHRLINILKGLRDSRNTVVVVEHDPGIMVQSDYILDLGPGAGDQGGDIVYFGPTPGISDSITGDYLAGTRGIPIPVRRRRPRRGQWLTIAGPREHNLKGMDVNIPLGLFVCLTGVSGSGKSTLAEKIIYRAVRRGRQEDRERAGDYLSVRGAGLVEDAVLVDQRPVGRSSRAIPMTYIKAMDPLRRLLAATPEAEKAGLRPTNFSFNTKPGRCETCSGEGFEKIEMQFLSDVQVMCPDCGGKRFRKEVLSVLYRGKNIHQILSMTVDGAMNFFRDQKKILQALEPLARVGLGHLGLGRPLNTLSGGEAQRLKLSSFLRAGDDSKRLFIFDEPTTGLHFQDIEILLNALQKLVSNGNTVLVIEHNMDVVKTADWVVDLGPEGGKAGGRIVAEGSPQKVAGTAGSHTGEFLKSYLEGDRRLPGGGESQRLASEPSAQEWIEPVSQAMEVRGAREHNLMNVDLDVPRNKLVVFSGVSGSGKSSLAFDILFNEGQHRYLQSLAPYARQHLAVRERPRVDEVRGLPPAVAIDQRVSHAGMRSTVATLTEIYHFLRLMYSRLGQPHCPGCGRMMVARGRADIMEALMERYGDGSALLLAPVVAGRKGFHKEVLARATRKGFKAARIDGEFVRLEKGMALSRYREHTIELVVGRPSPKLMGRMVDTCLEETGGSLLFVNDKGGEEFFSTGGICPECGFGLPASDPRLFSFNSPFGACRRCDGLGSLSPGKGSSRRRVCPECEGSRLRREALSVKIGGDSIFDLVSRTVKSLTDILKSLSFPGELRDVAARVVSEVLGRLDLMDRLGLAYLTLDRSGDTLSGGEAQRVRLAAQLGSNLTGVCYVLDEPTIGLHARDNRMLLNALKDLKRKGNSILVVEHDEETIKEADHIVDLGPGAGRSGGRVVAEGSVGDVRKNRFSVTGKWLRRRRRRITSFLRPYKGGPEIRVKGAVENNLKKMDASFPMGTLICVTGVSGSGKSTLLREVLCKGLHKRLSQNGGEGGECLGIEGWETLDRALEVDHSPIGRTPRSVPASYVGFLSEIRKLFAMTPEARSRGYGPARFSFNVEGGRCEECHGQGAIKVEMNFLPDVHIPCDSCAGRRYNRETLAVTYKGKTISEVLELTFDEAAGFFSAVPAIKRAVQFVCEIGLGYLQLGQPSPTLSGGEAQRMKISRELAGRAGRRTLYVLDEPTTGLHLEDIQKLLGIFHRLVERGNTVAVIEHNMEVIKEADYIMDLGPGGGEEGGRLLFSGSPEELVSSAVHSHTAQCLREYLGRGGVVSKH